VTTPTIRDEATGDEGTIRSITTAAFVTVPYSQGTEAAIIDALRRDEALTVSLVALDEGEIVGHIAFSPATIDGEQRGWFGVGPLSVRPDRQNRGIGGSLVRAGLERLRALGAKGCVLVGEPNYYSRFGFKTDARLTLDGVPPQYFQALSFGGELPSGSVSFHPGFGAKDE
jgi:putative acetyltransferase